MSKMLVENDKLFVIMTADKKCIVRGKTRYILATIEEERGNYKLYTCRHGSSVSRNMQSNKAYLNLTDNVKELYGTKSNYYKADELPELIAVRARTTYEVDL